VRVLALSKRSREPVTSRKREFSMCERVRECRADFRHAGKQRMCPGWRERIDDGVCIALMQAPEQRLREHGIAHPRRRDDERAGHQKREADIRTA